MVFKDCEVKMKKALILLVLILISSPVLAYFEPEWSEFCPITYKNIDLTKNYKLPIKKYWQQRRIDFNKNLGYCKSIENEEKRYNCFSELRRIEKEKTNIILNDMRNKAIIINSF